MVDYIGVSDIQRLVQAIGAGTFMERLAAEIEADYRRWGEFEKSARLASHSADGVIELMPTSDGRLYSFKYVNGHPRNTSVGLLTVTAFGVLADVDTGYPLLLSELTVTTALRTAAMSALAAKWMARSDSRVMALIGNGAQSEFQAIAFCRMGIEVLRLYDVDGAASAKLERNLRALPEFAAVKIVRTSSSAECLPGRGHCHHGDRRQEERGDPDPADAASRPAHQRPGRRLSRQDRAARRRAAHAWCARGGRVRAAIAHRGRDPADAGGFSGDRDLPTWSAARRPGATVRRTITIFDSVGFALEDYSALRFLYTPCCKRTAAAPARSTWCRNSRIRRICTAARSAAASARACG